MNSKLSIIFRDLGRILQILGGMFAVSVVIPLIFAEYYAVPSLIFSSLLVFGLGYFLSSRYADAGEPAKMHGMLIAASGWFVFAVFGSLPFLLISYTVTSDPLPAIFNVPELVPGTREYETIAAFRDPLNSFFESMSGITGTGLTMTDNEEALPHTLQWWRTFTEWVGGVGVIVLTTAILARPGSGSLTLYESEARSEKIHPSIISTVRSIWWIFLLFTFVAIFALWLAGMPIWEAINHAMTGLSTGGFSVTDSSIATYDSVVIDFVLLPIMIAGSIAFPVHYLILNGDIKNFYKDLQTRWLFVYFSVGTVLLIPIIYYSGSYSSWFRSFRYGIFQFLSAATCTGFQTATGVNHPENIALGDWSASGQLIVTGGMIIGGAAGSTVGGIKLIRLITLAKGTLWRINGVFYPSTAIRQLDLGARSLDDDQASQEIEEAAIITFLWFMFLAVGLFVLLAVIPEKFTLENAIFEVASAQGNVGLSSGITGPGMSWIAKVMFIFNMWIGRLEIIPVLVLLRGAIGGLGYYD